MKGEQMFECKECYKEATKQVEKVVHGQEEAGAEAYFFLHFEWNHGEKEKAGY